ncbi:MAG: hypothetical protein QF464_13320 [Myxococcota bacterium]|nr:hypothetical protein [Myxococcota bacterium]
MTMWNLRSVAALCAVVVGLAAAGCDSGAGTDATTDDGTATGDDGTSVDDPSGVDGGTDGVDADSVDGGGAVTDEPAVVYEWCDSALHFVYSPHEAELLQAFPDEYYTVDAGDGTRRPDFGVELAPWVSDLPDAFRIVFEPLGKTNTLTRV